MRYLSSFMQLRLYRNKEFLLDAIDNQKPRVGTEVVVMVKTKEDMARILNEKTFNLRYFKSAFSEKFLRVKMLAGGMKTVKQDLTDAYSNIKELLPNVSYTFLSVKQYNGKNIIYDASSRLSLLDNPMINSPIKYIKQGYALMDAINSDTRFSNYKKKYYIVEIDSHMKPDNNYYLRQNISSIPQVLMYRLINDPETLFEYIGTTFIFVNKTGIFTYFTPTAENLAPKTKENAQLVAKLKRWIKIMYAYNVGDVQEISESENEFEKDEPAEESPVEKKLDDVANKLFKGNKIGIDNLKSNIIKDIDSRVDDDLKNYAVEPDTLIDEPTSSDNISEILKRGKDVVDSTDDENPIGSHSKHDEMLDGSLFDSIEELDDIDDALDSVGKSDDSFGDEGDFDSDDNEEIIRKAVKVAKRSQISNHTDKELKRIKLLEDKVGKIKMSDDTEDIDKLLKDFEKLQIPETTLPGKVSNESIRHARVQDMTREYNAKYLDSTIAAIAKHFQNNPEIKMILTDATKKDISDNLNAMWKYTFKFEDEFGKKHTINYQIPKLVDNKFFLINGNKKMLNSQMTLMPVVKINSNQVNISTAHNRMELSRFGKSFDPKIESVKRFLNTKIPGNGEYGITVKIGDSTTVNSKYQSTLEYDDFASSIYSIIIKKSNSKNSISFVFNQHDIRSMMEDLGIAYVEKPALIPIAITGEKEIIYIDINTGKDSKTKKFTISDLIISAIRHHSEFENVDQVLQSISIPKKYMYTRLFYISRNIAFGVFLGYLYGLKPLMETMGVKWEFLPEKKVYENPSDKYLQNVIRFHDGYLYYDINPIRHSLILNGIMCEVDCEKYNFEDMNEEGPYLDTMDEVFRTRQMAKGYTSAKNFMMDPTSVQVMKYLGLPYEFLPVMLYANSLLEDNSKTDPKKLQINRIRKMEIITTMMYKSMVQAFNQYRNRSGRSTTTMNVKENDVLNRILESGVCNDYDTLNPIRELETEGTLTLKGPGGCQVDDAYTLARRAYDPSFKGVVAASSPDSGSVGITKYMSMNPRITNLLGFVKTGEDSDAKDIDYGNIGSIAELTTPFAIDHDDPKRLGFVTKESKHLMPAHDTDPLLIGNGVEKVFPYMVSNDFITFAKQDGKVLMVDKKLGLAIVEYKDGTKETIDIKERQHRDGGNSMYIAAKKEFNLNEGDKFKKNDILARNPSYFSIENGANAPEYNPGTLSNVAIIMSHVTYEDSSVITERIASRMSTDVILPKQIVLGAKSTVFSCVKPGDSIQVGEPLMVFEDELDDDELASVIANVDARNMKGMEDIARHLPKAKCTGVVHDVKVYYTVPYEEMSESVRAIVKRYDNEIKARKKKIVEFGASNPNEILNDFVGITKPKNDKINGAICPVGKILVEVYQRYTDYPGSGDKIVFYASMKTTIHRQLPQELAPYPVNHPERPIDALLSPISVNARMVTSILYALYGNKLVWMLKEKVRNIYNKYADDELKSVKTESYDTLPEPKKGAMTLEETLLSLGRTVEEIDEVLKEFGEK